MYEILDGRIIVAIKNGKNPLYEQLCFEESKKLARETGREVYRVIDGRLQSLRKAGKIKYLTKAESVRGRAGWYLA